MMSGYPETRDKFSVVVIRHQNIAANEEIWNSILDQAVSHLTESGILLITSYSCTEHAMMESVMHRMGMETYLSGRNPRSEMTITAPVEVQGILGRDKYVGIYGIQPATAYRSMLRVY